MIFKGNKNLHNIRFILNRKEPFKAAKIVNIGNIGFIIIAGTNWGRTREMGDSGFFPSWHALHRIGSCLILEGTKMIPREDLANDFGGEMT